MAEGRGEAAQVARSRAAEDVRLRRWPGARGPDGTIEEVPSSQAASRRPVRG